jgi:hypothetical protein
LPAITLPGLRSLSLSVAAKFTRLCWAQSDQDCTPSPTSPLAPKDGSGPDSSSYHSPLER